MYRIAPRVCIFLRARVCLYQPDWFSIEDEVSYGYDMIARPWTPARLAPMAPGRSCGHTSSSIVMKSGMTGKTHCHPGECRSHN